MSNVHQRIDELVKSNEVVLFMKGSFLFPKCRFSSTAIQILKAIGLSPKAVRTVDVLDDYDLRQGVKEYSRWPAIPILYVRGELIGGSDIMSEMYKSGEIQEFFLKKVDVPSHAFRTGVALVGLVKSTLSADDLHNDKRFTITIAKATFSNHLTAFCLSAARSAIRLHSTNDELLTGFEDQIAKEHAEPVRMIYAQRSQQYFDANDEKDPQVLNLKTPGDLLSMTVTADTINQLMISHVLNVYWDGVFAGSVSLLKTAGFFHA